MVTAPKAEPAQKSQLIVAPAGIWKEGLKLEPAQTVSGRSKVLEHET